MATAVGSLAWLTLNDRERIPELLAERRDYERERGHSLNYGVSVEVRIPKRCCWRGGTTVLRAFVTGGEKIGDEVCETLAEMVKRQAFAKDTDTAMARYLQ